MLDILGSPSRFCDGISRRDFLRIGGLGATGLALPNLLHAKPQAAKAKSCILLFMNGGPSQYGTFDLKPDAPVEVRGDFKPIATDIPGVQICDHLPMLARQAHKYAIVRSVSDDYAGGAHGQSVYLALTGHHSPRVQGDDVRPALSDYPCIGSAVAHLRPPAAGVPPFVWLLDMHRQSFAGEGGGCLGKKTDPFRVLQDPSRPQFAVQAIQPPAEVSLDRLGGRRGLLEQLSRQMDQQLGAESMTAHQERAFAMLGSAKFRTAFDLKAEPEPVRERYGKTKLGQGTLLARRLVEHGVPLVTVYWTGTEEGDWDTHYEETKNLKRLLPPTDRAVSALLEDLAQRGMLDDTLVVLMGEFGRAPLIEAKGGRGHWARCYSVALAGGGVRGGQVYGRSDRRAAYPAENPVGPADIVATIYHCLGIANDTEITDHLGRPLQLCQGSVIHPLLG
jgi:Protein of unknown function (DUF1501)